MDVNTILQLTWPAKPGQTLHEATSNWSRKALNSFIERWEKERAIPYSAVLEFAWDTRFPSVMFTETMQQGMVDLFSAGCSAPTIAQLKARAARSLSLNGVYRWTEKIELMEDGKARLYADKKHAAELRRIRKEYLQ